MIYINGIESLRDPESSEVTFDDRIEQVKLIKGNAVQDYGYIKTGDVMSLTCVFKKENYERLKEIWIGRQSVTYKDESGVEHSNLRLVFRKARYVSKFPKYITLTFELWSIPIESDTSE